MRSVGMDKFEPDPEQAEVLLHARGPLLVAGGPGTGKTAVLLERFARLIEGGADPDRTALVVGGRRGRQVARTWLLRRVSASLASLKVLTPHALAYHVVTHRYRALEYERPPDILSASDQFARVSELLAAEDPELWPAYGRMLGLRGFADEVRQFLLRAQEALLSPDEVLRKADAAGLPGWLELAGFYRRYLDVLNAEGVVDFAGLVLQAGASAGKGEPLFDHVLVDDYQDATLGTEWLLAEIGAQSLVVAGDAGSHIFSFQGTTDVPLRRFAERFGATGSVELVTNHRASGLGLVREAWSTSHTSEEHAAIARELRRVHAEEGVPWRDLAVVVRRQGGHIGGLLRALDDAGVPRRVPERRLSLQAEPATHPYLLALRWIARPEGRDELIEPLLSSDLTGLSPAAARGVVRAARSQGLAAAAALERPGTLLAPERESVAALAGTLREAEAIAGRSAQEAFRVLWQELAYSKRLVRGTEAPAESQPDARRDLDAILAFSEAVADAPHGDPGSLVAFLDSLEAGEEGPGVIDPTAEEAGDSVRVYTAHAIAGQEFDTLIVAGATEGDFPSLARPEPMFDLGVLERRIHQSERNRIRLEDERRLWGVVMTRSRRRLVLFASDPHGDETAQAGRSRFAAELGLEWIPAPSAPFPQLLTVAEATAAWRRSLADPTAAPWMRLAALDGIQALGVDRSHWWFQRGWTGTDRPLHESIRVSHSRLEKLENCDLQYVLGQELGLETRVGYHAWVGSLVHGIIEDCEGGLIERTEEAMLAAAESRWKRQEFPSLAVSEAFRGLVTKVMLPAWFREYGGTPAVAREQRFEFGFDGATVTGYIDRVGGVDGGGTSITDYKTGKSRNAGKAEDNLQLGIYYLAINQAEELARFRPVKGVELVFLRDTDRWTGQIARAAKGFSSKEGPEYEEQMSLKVSGLIGRLRDLQVSENYRPNPSAQCRFCDFKTLCSLWPEGQELFGARAERERVRA
jgi:superfamily I DNA/RNA helicase/RecB family exonuclease